MSKGYQSFRRGDGSPWYLCDYCEAQAYVSNSEIEMMDHVKEKHLK